MAASCAAMRCGKDPATLDLAGHVFQGSDLGRVLHSCGHNHSHDYSHNHDNNPG